MNAPIEPSFRRAFAESGQAIFTIVSKKSGNRFTYRMRGLEQPPKPLTQFFVDVLTGPENSNDYTFIGTVFTIGAAPGFYPSRKSRISSDAPSVRGFKWCWANLDSEDFELWHAGACGRCGRQLTDPESIERGLGPVCAEKT